MKNNLLSFRWGASFLFLLCLVVTIRVGAQTVLNVGSGQTYTSIQSAINAASAVQVDTINIVTSPITEAGIIVNKNVVIRGQGVSQTIVQASVSPGIATNRVFTVSITYTVTMENMTIRNGRSPVGSNNATPSGIGGNGADGGGIYNLGTLHLRNCSLENNYCGNGGNGGPGSYPAGGPGVACGLGGNGGNGGAVYNEGLLIIHRCTFSGNKAGNGGLGGVPAAGYWGGSVPGDLNGGPGTAGGSAGNGGHGGAIYNAADLTLVESTFSGNTAGNGGNGRTGSDGGDGANSLKAAVKSGSGGNGGNGGAGGMGGNGAVYNSNIIDTIRNCTFYNNAAGSGGTGGLGGNGGVGMVGADSVQSPVVGPPFYGGEGGDGSSGGQGGAGGNAGKGGAIYNDVSGMIYYICNVTFNQNVAGALAGNGGNGGNCGAFGFAGNASPSPPGIMGQPGQVGTNGSGGNGGASGYGGAYYTVSGLASFKNSIIAGNSLTPVVSNGGLPGTQIMGNSGVNGANGIPGLGPDAYGTVVSLGYNLVGKKDNSSFLNGISNDICGTIAVPVNPQLGPLADNGGPTKTLIISASSQARDNADPTDAPLLDQRGMSRFGTIDRGAYEYHLPSITMSDDGNIWEGAENGEVITVTVLEDVFNSTINASGFTLTNLPVGVTRGSVVRTGDHSVSITLSGNRTVDYDSDITNVTLDVSHTELAGLTSGALSANTGVVLHAYIESVTATTDTVLFEYYLNGDTINLELSGDRFLDNTLLPANFILTNAPAGVSVAQALYQDSTHARLILGYTGQDYDMDSTHATVTVLAAEIYGAGDLISNMLTFVASTETGVEEFTGEPSYLIYPNPAEDFITIEPRECQVLAVELFRNDGRLVSSIDYGNTGLSETCRLDISLFPAGIYFLRVRTNTGETGNRIMIR